MPEMNCIRIEYTRSQDLVRHSPTARRQRWTTITTQAKEIERIETTHGWEPYTSLWRVVHADEIQGYYLVEE